MFDFIVLVFVLIPSILAFALYKTPAWWVMGMMIIVGGLLALGDMEPASGDVGGIGALANAVRSLAGTGFLVLGGIVLALSGSANARSRRKDETRPASLPPVASGVADVTEVN